MFKLKNRIYSKVYCATYDGSPYGDNVIKETPLRLFINSEEYITAMILPAMETEYITGLLHVNGIIAEAKDISSIRIKNGNAHVRLRTRATASHGHERIYSEALMESGDIIRCVYSILKSPVFMRTEAVHSAGIFLLGKKKISIAEDTGRHNAMDKAIGSALIKKTDFTRCLAVSTGRQPPEMIMKYRAAGIPVIATKGTPTAAAVRMAEDCGITIAGLVRHDAMTVYSHPGRIK
jgi:FdhD protein